MMALYNNSCIQEIFVKPLLATNWQCVVSSEVAYAIHTKIIEPVHKISNNAVCATSKASGQPAHTRSLIRAFATRLSIL